jgi:hypothetical protein
MTLEGFEIKCYAPALSYTMLSVHAITKNTEAVAAASNEFGLEVNADINQYMVMSRDQNARRSHSIRLIIVTWKGRKN